MRKLTLQSRQTAIFLMGPTASGKTSLALALRNRLPVEIVSVDSALIYSGMDIGTAKPSAEDLVQAPHRLIDIRDPADDYSAADFIRNALDEMEDIITAGSIPLLVGGTMLYFKVLLDGLSQLPNADNSLRTHIYRKAETMGLAYLHRQLQNIDPISANRIHPNDLHRLERALEVFFVEGNTITELTKISGEAIVYRVYQFSIAPLDRALLHQRVERRFYNMLEAGFENEVRKLFSRGDIHRDMQSIRCVGYRNMWSYLSDEMSYDEMVFSVICATRQLAKRQMTWLRSWPEVNWLDSEQPIAAFDSILKIVSA